MRVLFINLVYRFGSTGKIISDTMKLLKENNHEVKVLYGVGERTTDPDAIKITGRFEFYTHNYISRFTDHAGLYSKIATHAALKEIRNFKPNIIHVHTLHGFYINYEILFDYLKTCNIPIIMTLHDCWTFTGHCTHFSQAKCTQWKSQCEQCSLLRRYPQCYLKGDIKNNFLRKKQSFCNVNNMTLTVPSKWLADQVSYSFLSNYPVEVIPNGYDKKIFSPTDSTLRTQYNLVGKKIVLGVANSWNERKGLKDMIKLAFSLDNKYKVVIIGLRESQLKEIPSSVLGITRTSNQKELAQWYSTADVFVNPTYEETFGMTTVESQACGTPVVVYKTDGCPETVAEGNGYLVPQGNLYELQVAIEKIIAAGQGASVDAVMKFEKDVVYQKYMNLYMKLANKL